MQIGDGDGGGENGIERDGGGGDCGGASVCSLPAIESGRDRSEMGSDCLEIFVWVCWKPFPKICGAIYISRCYRKCQKMITSQIFFG